MSDKFDAYDPTYSNDPNYTWDSGAGEWIEKGSAPGSNLRPTDPKGPLPQHGFWDPTKPERRGTPISQVPGNEQIIGAAKPSAFAEKARDIAMDRAMGGGLPTNALSTSDTERARGAQMSMLEQLLKQARGEADSPAQMMLQQAADRNLSDASAMAASQRGLGATAAASQVSGQRAQIGQEAARDAGILRLQEQMQATQAASRVAEGLRGQDLAQEQARAQVALASDSLRESLKQKYLQMGMDSAEADRRANMEMTALQTQAGLGKDRLNLDRYVADRKFANEDRQFWLDLIGNVGKMAVSAAGA
jgi:hypothetical protein